MSNDVVYPSVELILDLHQQIVEKGDNTESGVRSEDDIESAVRYVSDGFFGEVPSTIHEKAVQLMRFLVANYPFVDGTSELRFERLLSFI
nr:Fic family protein [Natrialba hulunbeirensis]